MMEVTVTVAVDKILDCLGISLAVKSFKKLQDEIVKEII